MGTLTIDLAKEFGKSKFWGNIDSNRVKLFIEEKINNSNNAAINIDLSGVKHFDLLFVEEVFVYIIKFINNYKGKKTLYFSTPQDYKIVYALEVVLKQNKVSAALKRGDYICVKGYVAD